MILDHAVTTLFNSVLGRRRGVWFFFVCVCVHAKGFYCMFCLFVISHPAPGMCVAYSPGTACFVEIQIYLYELSHLTFTCLFEIEVLQFE